MTPDTSDNPTLTLDGARLSDVARIRYMLKLETEANYDAIEIVVPHATSIDPPGPRPPPTPRAHSTGEVCEQPQALDSYPVEAVGRPALLDGGVEAGERLSAYAVIRLTLRQAC